MTMKLPSTRDGPAAPSWDATDAELAALLRQATDEAEPPARLLREPSGARAAWAAVIALLAVGLLAWGLIDSSVPPQVVRDAMLHEHREATLRGDFQPDKQPLRLALGLPQGGTLPGLVQLERPCDIAGRKAFHVTTFIENGGGMVTLLAFDKTLPELRPGETGRWFGRYWRVARGTDGNTVLLLADNAPVLAETAALLHGG